jgi:hypothetical protein
MTRSDIPVVCKGFIPARSEITISGCLFSGVPVQGAGGAYSYPRTACRRGSSRSGMDSDLEAFSHNPADGSVAALPGRTAAKTNYLKPRFLSY